MSRRGPFLVTLFVCIAYMVFACVCVVDYGITFDDPEQFGVGHKNLSFYLSGHVNYKDDQPAFVGHERFYNHIVRNLPHHVWPLPPVLSAAVCRIVSSVTDYYDPIAAHHLIIPLITAFFLLFFFFFITRHTNVYVAAATVMLLGSYPRFFGHSMSNIKDVPEVAFFTLALAYFYDWFVSGKAKYLYLSSFMWACAFVTKVDAILIPVIIVLWLTVFIWEQFSSNGVVPVRTLVHLLGATLLAALVVMLSYPQLLPWYYTSFKAYVVGSASFVYTLLRYCIGIGTDNAESWNVYALRQVGFATPLPMLLVAGIGSMRMLLVRDTKRLHSFVLIWLFLPLVRHCLPFSNHYDGLRHFLVFVAPFAFVSVMGVWWFSGVVAHFVRLDRVYTFSIFVGFTFAFNMCAVITMHPFQTTYFNILAGGLGGAQNGDVPFSSDYWYQSGRAVAAWLSKHAAVGAAVVDVYHMGLYNMRSDLCLIPSGELEKYPAGTYVAYIPRRWMRMDIKMKLLSEDHFVARGYTRVHTIIRQHGEIARIYRRTA